nr:MAG TPA: hypothetical protein [Caudoviricetes sp.]
MFFCALMCCDIFSCFFVCSHSYRHISTVAAFMFN